MIVVLGLQRGITQSAFVAGRILWRIRGYMFLEAEHGRSMHIFLHIVYRLLNDQNLSQRLRNLLGSFSLGGSVIVARFTGLFVGSVAGQMAERPNLFDHHRLKFVCL
jgi:hypothetical protein